MHTRWHQTATTAWNSVLDKIKNKELTLKPITGFRDQTGVIDEPICKPGSKTRDRELFQATIEITWIKERKLNERYNCQNVVNNNLEGLHQRVFTKCSVEIVIVNKQNCRFCLQYI